MSAPCASHGCFIATRNNETTAVTPCTILNFSRGYRHQIRTRSSCACLARGLKRHGATQTPPLWEDVCIMSEEPQSEGHCATKSISQRNTPKDWEFELLTKLLVLGQQPAQTQEPETNEITFLGPTLSTFDSPSGHHCVGIPKSKGEQSNPIVRAS